ncbi:MAG: response regulator transcription factor [Desulfobacteraceae bacterium]|nr:response regulator transcription factor [Desulfobacteraceae bacterium]
MNPVQKHHILVVDDDPDIRTILEDNLRLDGYTPDMASCGQEALDIFDRYTPELVVLDLMLPDMDGIQVCRAIRGRSPVPIIMLTAKDGISDKVLGLESGADDYLVKPFDYLELAARINACLRRMQTSHPSGVAQEINGLFIDPDTREVMVGGRSVNLTKKEFEILSLLSKHAGCVLDRHTIRREIWPDKTLYKWSRAIDVHVQHLRSKVEENPDQPNYILTVQGVGYKLNTSSSTG